MNEPSIFSLLLDVTLQKIENGEDYLKARIPNAARAAQRLLRKGLWIALGSFALSIPLFIAGIYFNRTELIIFSGTIRVVITVALLLLTYPIGILFGLAISESLRTVTRWWLRLIYSFSISELLIILIFSIIPFRNNLEMVPLFIFVTCFLGLLGVWTAKPKLTAAFVICVFGTLVFGFVQPHTFAAFQNTMTRHDENSAIPQQVNITCPDLRRNKYPFFGPGGKNYYWYWFDPERRTVTTFTVPGNNYTNPNNGQRLMPLTKDVFGAFEKILCEEWEAQQKALWEKSETERLERERLAAEQAERERIAEEERSIREGVIKEEERIQREELAQAERERAAQTERERLAQAEREREEQRERAERERLAREQSAQADRVSYARPEPEQSNRLADRFISAQSMVNLPQSTEVAVLITDQEYKPLDRPSHEIAGRLLLFSFNTSGDFFNRSSAFEIMTRIYQGDRQLIADLSLHDRVDFLVLGIATGDSSRRRRGENQRGFLMIRVIPTRENARGYEELPPIPIEAGNSKAADERMARFIINQIIERLRV